VIRRYVVRPIHEAELDALADHLAESSATTAARFYRAAIDTMERLVRFPGSGALIPSRQLKLQDIQVKPIRGFGNHLIFYRVVDDQIEIVRVLHAARDWARLIRHPEFGNE
jgi:toxin ParE1/3/4